MWTKCRAVYRIATLHHHHLNLYFCLFLSGPEVTLKHKTFLSQERICKLSVCYAITSMLRGKKEPRHRLLLPLSNCITVRALACSRAFSHSHIFLNAFISSRMTGASEWERRVPFAMTKPRIDYILSINLSLSSKWFLYFTSLCVSSYINCNHLVLNEMRLPLNAVDLLNDKLNAMFSLS